ncbi:MAG: peptide chain release factor 2 [Enterobacter sp.]|nr:peptide chain release factor 2 [Enterobacter sp.]
MVDLAGDIAPLLDLDADALRERLYTPKSELGDLAAVPIKLVHLNKCPVLAQQNTLRPQDADRLGINIQRCLENAQRLRANPQVREKAVAIFAEAEPFVPSDNVDTQLYNGFFSDADRAAMKIILETEPRNLPALDITFADKRIERLLFNYRARNYPGTLDEAEQQRWLEHRRQVFTPEFLQAYADELQMLYQQYADDKEKLAQLEFRRMFSGEYDSADCYLDIQAGSGGTEAQDWASMLMRMYLRWAEARGFKTEIIEESEGEVAGIKSVTIKIIGDYAYGWLRTETGVHRLVRKSPFDSGGRRHTSFSSAFVYPEVDEDIDIDINPADLRIDVYRASGAGGQHVNRTESAVRITHIPTGLVTQCQNDRSQHKNKDQAMKQMKAKLYELEMQKKNAEKQAMEDTKSDIGWGSQIRSYVLDDSRIKDLRTGVETRNTQAVLDGSLDQFIEASLKAGL